MEGNPFRLTVLPIQQQKIEDIFKNPEKSKTENEVPLEIRLAKAFLHQRYPLTKEGLELKDRVSLAMKTRDLDALRKLRDELPTIENPRSELFRELICGEEDCEDILGSRLTTIQTSKGCRHGCLHCAASAGKKVGYMPYMGAVKLYEMIGINQEKIERLWPSWEEELSKLPEGEALPLMDKTWELAQKLKSMIEADPDLNSLGTSFFSFKNQLNFFEKRIPSYFALSTNFFDLYRERNDFLPKVFWEIFDELEDTYNKARSIAEKKYAEHPIHRLLQSRASSVNDSSFGHTIPLSIQDFLIPLMHHADSDPFDYRDTSFLHDNGSPADYADIVALHIKSGRKDMQFTTAGWQMALDENGVKKPGDKVAQRAAEKLVSIARENPDLIGGRISITPFERTYGKDMEGYYKHMRNVLITLAGATEEDLATDKEIKPPMHLQAIFLYDEDLNPHPGFLEKVAKPLQELCERLGISRNAYYNEGKENKGMGKISRFSGRAASDKQAIEDYDVMGCLPGYTIEPDGKVLFQSMEADMNVHKGVERKFIGVKMFEVEPK